MSTTIATMTAGQAGTVLSGKFAGRTFTVRGHGTQGVITSVNWTEQGTTGSIRSTTEVEAAPEECAACAALGWVEMCDNCSGRATSFAPVIEAAIAEPSISAKARALAKASGHKSWDALPQLAKDEYMTRAEAILPSITAAEARARVLLTAQNTFAVGDTVRCTLPEFAGTVWSEPMNVERIQMNSALGKPVFARNADGTLGAFSPADLELV